MKNTERCKEEGKQISLHIWACFLPVFLCCCCVCVCTWSDTEVEKKQLIVEFTPYIQFAILIIFLKYLLHAHYKNYKQYHVCVCVCVAQSCPTLCNPMDYSPPNNSVSEIFQARILEWVAIPFSRASSGPRDRPCISFTAGSFFAF